MIEYAVMLAPVAGSAPDQISPLDAGNETFPISHSAPVCDHLPILTRSLSALCNWNKKLWHFKDYLYFSRAVEPPFFFPFWNDSYIYKSPPLRTQPLARVCLQKKKKNQRPFKKGNHNIISIFSFRCLNWHEEYNQISLLTVTHMPLQEREKYHLPAYIPCQDVFFSFLSFSFYGEQVCVH